MRVWACTRSVSIRARWDADGKNIRAANSPCLVNTLNTGCTSAAQPERFRLLTHAAPVSGRSWHENLCRQHVAVSCPAFNWMYSSSYSWVRRSRWTICSPVRSPACFRCYEKGEAADSFSILYWGGGKDTLTFLSTSLTGFMRALNIHGISFFCP